MTRQTDAVAKLLSRLSLRGVPLGGRPPARRPSQADPGRTLHPFTGSLHPARCGATSTQTRSPRLDGETTLDLAACLAAVTDPLDAALLLFVGLPDWLRRADLTTLREGALALLATEAARCGWTLVRDDGEDFAPAIADAVLNELAQSPACTLCNTNGMTFSTDPEKPGLVECPACRGTGRARLGIKPRAKAIGMRESRFRGSAFQLAYDWLLRHLNARVGAAGEAVATMRGHFEVTEPTLTAEDRTP
jgi:hypothetical protein